MEYKIHANNKVYRFVFSTKRNCFICTHDVRDANGNKILMRYADFVEEVLSIDNSFKDAFLVAFKHTNGSPYCLSVDKALNMFGYYFDGTPLYICDNEERLSQYFGVSIEKIRSIHRVLADRLADCERRRYIAIFVENVLSELSKTADKVRYMYL